MHADENPRSSVYGPAICAKTSLECFELLTCKSLPFRQEKQKIDAEVAEKSHAEAKILHGFCALYVEALGCGYATPYISWSG